MSVTVCLWSVYNPLIMFDRTTVCILAIFATVFLSTLFAPVQSCSYGKNRRSSAPLKVVKRDTQCTCDPRYRFRSIDGRCNNLGNPDYGTANYGFSRVMDPVYDNDDGQTPRLHAKDGSDLPNARLVSTTVHDEEVRLENDVSLFTMQFGQFIDHGFSKTPATVANGSCCSDELVLSGAEHPDVTTGGPCFPIIIPEGDRYFTSTRCLEFTRSEPLDSSSDVRQQYSEITFWIDGSQIYGHTEDLASQLRSYNDGKLAVLEIDGKDFLPNDTDAFCFEEEEGDYCFLAGDSRLMVFPGLNALHLIFVRYHNQMCDRLKALHSDWDDELLYQEARKIVVGALQVVAYEEFLVEILGRANARAFNLLFEDPDYEYDPSIDPALRNVFATAAYRFGHSLMVNEITIDGETIATTDLFNRPKYLLNSFDGVVKAFLEQSVEEMDIFYTDDMTDKLFEFPGVPQTGTDVVARNIQRGRDHGLASYNDWREHYGLGRKANFAALDSGSAKYASVYTSVDDIDMYSGALSETPSKGAMVGELYLEIIGTQFRDLKFADRFWFENPDGKGSFTSEQIKEIAKIRLSKIICDTVDDITEIQGSAMRTVNPISNRLVDCSTLDDINIEKYWGEEEISE